MISGTRYRLTAEINRQTDLAREIARAQMEISTGKKILAPSDDPIGAARVAEIGRTQADEEAWSRNVETAASLASRADTTLASVERGMVRAQELMLAAASDTLSADNRATIAAELNGIAEDIAALVDTRDSRGALLFSRGDALEIPVNAGVRVAPVASRAEIFEAIDTPAGPADLVAILTGAADAVVETDPVAREAASSAAIEALDAGTQHIIAARGEQGVRASRIDNIRDRLDESALQLTEQRDGIEATDVVEVVARLESRRLTLQAAQAVFARVNQNSLFDLLS
jgi:flagellar hook-associated protein 3 FlgL